MRLKDLEPQILQNRLSFVRYIQDAITKQRETHMNTLVIGWELSFLVCLRSITFRRTQNRTANRQLGQTDTLFSLSGSGAINSIRIELCKRCGDLANCGGSKTASFAADYRCIVTQMKRRTTDWPLEARVGLQLPRLRSRISSHLPPNRPLPPEQTMENHCKFV